MKIFYSAIFILFVLLGYSQNYRTQGNVTFSSPENWLIYLDDEWKPATNIPDYKCGKIFISQGDTAKIDCPIKLDQLIVVDDATLINCVSSDEKFELNDTAGSDLILMKGSKYIIAKECTQPMPCGSGSILVSSGATIEVQCKKGACFYACDSLQIGDVNFKDRIVWNDSSIFRLNVASNFSILTKGYTYFPNVETDVVPIMQFSSNTLNQGANSNTRINGLVVIDENCKVTWQYAGKKIFRNGIINKGEFVAKNNCGSIVIGENSGKIGGEGKFDLNQVNVIVGNGNFATMNVETSVDWNNANLSVLPNTSISFNNNYFKNLSNINVSENVEFEISTQNGLADCLQNCSQIENSENLSLKCVGNVQNLGLNKDFQLKNLELSIDNTLDLQYSLTLQNLFLQNGKISVSENAELYVKNAITSESYQSYIIGNLKLDVVNNENLLFPLGNDSEAYFANIVVSENQNLQTIEMSFCDSVIDEVFEENLLDGKLFKHFVNSGFWRLKPNQNYGSVNYSLQLDFPQSELSDDDNSLMLVKRLSPKEKWGSGSQGFGSKNEINNNRCIVANKNINGFSDAVVLSYDMPLPIVLSNFEAFNVANSNILNWTTQSEHNSEYIEILKSRDALNFYSIGKLSAQGNSSEPCEYSFEDNTNLSLINYYKLKIVDFDGSYSYSPIISTNSILNKIVIENAKIHCNEMCRQMMIFDLSGQCLLRSNDNYLNLSALPNGVYNCVINFQNKNFVTMIYKYYDKIYLSQVEK